MAEEMFFGNELSGLISGKVIKDRVIEGGHVEFVGCRLEDVRIEKGASVDFIKCKLNNVRIKKADWITFKDGESVLENCNIEDIKKEIILENSRMHLIESPIINSSIFLREKSIISQSRIEKKGLRKVRMFFSRDGEKELRINKAEKILIQPKHGYGGNLIVYLTGGQVKNMEIKEANGVVLFPETSSFTKFLKIQADKVEIRKDNSGTRGAIFENFKVNGVLSLINLNEFTFRSFYAKSIVDFRCAGCKFEKSHLGFNKNKIKIEGKNIFERTFFIYLDAQIIKECTFLRCRFQKVMLEDLNLCEFQNCRLRGLDISSKTKGIFKKQIPEGLIAGNKFDKSSFKTLKKEQQKIIKGGTNNKF